MAFVPSNPDSVEVPVGTTQSQDVDVYHVEETTIIKPADGGMPSVRLLVIEGWNEGETFVPHAQREIILQSLAVVGAMLAMPDAGKNRNDDIGDVLYSLAQDSDNILSGEPLPAGARG